MLIRLACAVLVQVIRRLAEISMEQSTFRQAHDMIDTSEKGDWEGWRGERLTARNPATGSLETR